MLFRDKKIKAGQKVLLFRQLSFLLTPDFSILEAIEFLRDDLDDKKLDKVFVSMQQDLERGLALSDSSKKYPSLFTDSESRLIEIGEKGGTLPKVFANLAEDNERKYFVDKLWKKLLRSALFYIIPAVLLLFFFLSFIIPAYAQFFSELGSTLPLPTQIIVAASQKWSLVIYILFFFGLLSLLKKRIGYVKSAVDFTILCLPIIGYLSKQIAIDKLVRALTLLISNQTAAGETVRLAAMALDNNFLRRKVLKFSELADIENRVSAALRNCKFIPKKLVRIITTAEQKDYDPAILEFAKNYYAEDTLESIIRAQEKLQMVMRVVFGIFIGIIVVALYMPVFRMGSLF